MTHRKPMTEREKDYLFCLLFPFLWPLAFAMAIEDLAKAVRNGFRKLRGRNRGEKDNG